MKKVLILLLIVSLFSACSPESLNRSITPSEIASKGSVTPASTLSAGSYAPEYLEDAIFEHLSFSKELHEIKPEYIENIRLNKDLTKSIEYIAGKSSSNVSIYLIITIKDQDISNITDNILETIKTGTQYTEDQIYYYNLNNYGLFIVSSSDAKTQEAKNLAYQVFRGNFNADK